MTRVMVRLVFPDVRQFDVHMLVTTQMGTVLYAIESQSTGSALLLQFLSNPPTDRLMSLIESAALDQQCRVLEGNRRRPHHFDLFDRPL